MSEPVSVAGAARALVAATNNGGKLRELRRLLAAHPVTVVGLADAGWAGELVEPGDTYAENALAKAAAVSARLALPALADDSGIEVDALGGWPGPRSARWLGPEADDADRLAALIAEVERRSPGDRRVRYVCVVALSRPAAEPVIARGECLGTLVAPRGTGGFGYDPAFLSDDLGVTFAEAGDLAKDGVSHRGRALRRLAESGVLDLGPDAA
ncbi:MAG TPA: non-canonical purine NTP pyrophosphatase [Candidatus Dormibacteraeota bacterium]|nr:non-canonical purine NTP pyrophosphatase [Candidatus Dormibacteraeota bacterium]